MTIARIRYRNIGRNNHRAIRNIMRDKSRPSRNKPRGIKALALKTTPFIFNFMQFFAKKEKKNPQVSISYQFKSKKENRKKKTITKGGGVNFDDGERKSWRERGNDVLIIEDEVSSLWDFAIC